MRQLLFLIILCASAGVNAQGEYNADRIAPRLKEKTNAVIRLSETTFIRQNIGKALERKHLVVTIFNEKGEEEFATYQVFYDKLVKLKSLKGALYDRDGKQVEKLKKSNVTDYTWNNHLKFVSDDRRKIARFDKRKYAYPYTVEYISETETKNLMFYPNLDLSSYTDVGIEKASLVIITPDELTLRYKELNMPAQCLKIEQKEKIKTYSWTLEQQLFHDEENFLEQTTRPVIFTSAVEFEVEGYRGNINNWGDISRFCYELNKDRDQLPEAVKTKVHELTANETDPVKKIEKLYNYLQENTHYMSIQLGIGGWQTMSAAEVAEKGYGDCKALSNYMKALLKEAGITAYQALINGGNDYRGTTGDFPCMRFNHVIVCVPVQQDSIWLECTSQTDPPGYLGSFTSNRKALVINAGGGLFVNTSSYQSSDNVSRRKTTVKLENNGNAKATLVAAYIGISQDYYNAVIHYLDKEKQKRTLTESLSIPGFELDDFTLTEIKGRIPKTEVKLELRLKKMTSKTGAHVFLNPNLLGDFMEAPLDIEPRQNPFFLEPNKFNFQTQDTIIYQLPLNYTPEHLPASLQLSSEFGSYAISFTVKENNLIYTRAVEMRAGTYPAADFSEFVEYVKKIKRADRSTVIFIEKK